MRKADEPKVLYRTEVDFADSREVHLAFGFRSRDLEPDEISRTLLVVPHHAFKRGDPFPTPAGERKRPFGVWAYSTEGLVLSDKPEAHAIALLEVFGSKVGEIESIRASGLVHANMSLAIRTDSRVCAFDLPSRTMTQLLAFCDELTVRVFAESSYLAAIGQPFGSGSN